MCAHLLHCLKDCLVVISCHYSISSSGLRTQLVLAFSTWSWFSAICSFSLVQPEILGSWELLKDLDSHPNFGTTSFHNLGKQFSVTRMWAAPQEGREHDVAFGVSPEGGKKS